MISLTAPSGTHYLRRREAQERAAASSASDAAVRRVHLAMADRYAALLHGAALRGIPAG